MRRIERDASPMGLDESPPDESANASVKDRNSNMQSIPRLFLIGGTEDISVQGSGMMGLGPHAAQVGDYVCRIYGIEKSVILRKIGLTLKIVGTAGLAKNRDVARQARDNPSAGNSVWAEYSFKWNGDGVYVDLYADMPYAFELLGE